MRTSQWNILRKSTKAKPMTSPHIGTDFRARVGTDLYSLGDGTVKEVDRNKGNLVVEYQNGDRVTFRHLNSIGSFGEGDQVFEGQIIGQTGKRRTSVPHLHLDAVNSDGEQINIEERNYGSVTNDRFFNEFKGDYKKLKAYKEGLKNGDVSSYDKSNYNSDTWKQIINGIIKPLLDDND